MGNTTLLYLRFPPSATVPAVIAPTPVLTARDAYMKANGKIYYGICVKSLQSLPDEYGTGIPVASGSAFPRSCDTLSLYAETCIMSNRMGHG